MTKMNEGLRNGFQLSGTWLNAGLIMLVMSQMLGCSDRKEIVTKCHDVDKNKSIQECYYYKDGELFLYEIDRNGDGLVDYWRYMFKQKTVWVQYDTTFSGVPDRWIIYDSGGRALRQEEDQNEDGKADVVKEISTIDTKDHRWREEEADAIARDLMKEYEDLLEEN